jgi:O-antigen/teichoic acid export membrane protein
LSSEAAPYKSYAAGKRAFLEHYGSTVLGQGLTLALGVLTGILSARMLGPIGRGDYAAIIIWPSAIASFLAFGVNQAIAYHLGQRSFTVSEVATGASFIGLIQCALSILIGLAAIPFVLAYHSTTVLHLGIIFVLATPALIFSMYTANIFQGMQDLAKFNLIRTLAPLTYAICLLTLFLIHEGTLSAIIASQIVGYIAAFGIGVAMVFHCLRPRVLWNSSNVPCLLHFGARTQGLSVAYFVNQRIDQLVLSLLVTPKELGLYAVAVSLSTSIAFLPQAAGIVAFSRGSGQHVEEAMQTAGVAFRTSLIWLLIVCVLLFAIAPQLIRIVFGPTFEGSILACRILLPGALVTGLNFVLYSAASALGRPGLASYAEGASVLVTTVGLYLLVPRYGYVGAAIVSSAAYTVSFVIMLTLAHRCLNLSLKSLIVASRYP